MELVGGHFVVDEKVLDGLFVWLRSWWTTYLNVHRAYSFVIDDHLDRPCALFDTYVEHVNGHSAWAKSL